MKHTWCSSYIVLVLVAASAAFAGATPAEICQAGKNRIAGKYAACRHAAEAALAMTGDAAVYAKQIAKCHEKYSTAWRKLEEKPRAACPSTGDEVAIGDAIVETTTNVASAVGGGPFADCKAELAQCAAEPHGRVLKTGQAACFDDAGAPIACDGTGQDGALQVGLARSYADNGDGTITDERTGLTWEKLSDDGGIHDMDDRYTWADAFAVKVAALNEGTGFAGHTDWRVPNRFELESLVDLGTNDPAIPAAFATACVPGCTILDCSCTASTYPDRIYWSSTASFGFPPWAWRVDYNSGDIVSSPKETLFYVRAVRGGH